jgi:MoxR-like ATPase
MIATNDSNNIISIADAHAAKLEAVIAQASKLRSTANLDINSVPKIVGKGPIERVKEIYKLLISTPMPLYLIGDTGTGKSATMKKVLALYSKHFNVPAYYFQLSQEDTKSTVIEGYRLIDGTLIPFDGVVAQAAKEGAIVGIDEITHSTPRMLLNLNGLDGSDSVLTTGACSIDASKMRIIYGSNATNVGGNCRIPASFANRVIAIPFEYQTLEDEILITKAIASRNLFMVDPDDINRRKLIAKPVTVPESVIRYICSYIAGARSPEYALSPRNSAKAIVQLENVTRKPIDAKKPYIDPHFSTGSNTESICRMISERILGEVVKDTSLMQKPEVLEFLTYVSSVGIEQFRRIIQISVGFFIDIDGQEMMQEATRQKLLTSII